MDGLPLDRTYVNPLNSYFPVNLFGQPVNDLFDWARAWPMSMVVHVGAVLAMYACRDNTIRNG